MDNRYIFFSVLIIAAVTALLRFLPFLIFRDGKKTPEIITWFGKTLPFAIIGMLVVFCLKGVSFTSGSHGIPELVCVAITVLLHLWKKNTLLSISVATICYMLLVQFVF